jgi:endo-1,4-beta-xylanase
MMPSRREALAMAAGALGGVLDGAPGSALASDAAPLKAAAAKAGLIFGAAGGQTLFDDADYRALFVAQAAILTPENALKFNDLQPRQGEFFFAPADALVDGALKQGLLVRGHTLAWNDWPAPWLKTMSRRDVVRALDLHLETVVPHFAGRLQSWDVVNEPFWLGADKPGTFRPGPWYDAMGIDYIFHAFRRTAMLDPHAKLVLNEAFTERSDPVGLAVRRSLLLLIDRIQDKGLKIDAVGLQGHLTPQIPYDDAGFADFLHEIARRKVEIYITEFDVDDESYPDDVVQRDAAVAARTSAFLTATLAVPAVTMIVTWGLSDRYSWWRDPETMAAHGLDRLARPLPYDDMLHPKPMRDAMIGAFMRRGEFASRP